MSRLLDKYKKEVLSELQKEFSIKNSMAVPRLEKILINIGVGEAIQNAKVLDSAKAELSQITGQAPVVARAKKSISAFKLRKGVAIACHVTLRNKRMYEFFDRLVNIAMPRIRDFRGLSPKGFDGRGSYTLGLSEQTVFPEVDPDKVQFTQGMDITIVTTARTDAEGQLLLRKLGMPFGAR